MEIRLADINDIEEWISLVKKVKENFPGLETNEAIEEHKKTVIDFINKSSAICAKLNNKIIGILLFSRYENVLCFLAVDPDYRRNHTAQEMFYYMLNFMQPNNDISVTTYREGVPEGIAARKFYKKMGFTEAELTEEFGAPVQVFILKRQKTPT